MYGSTDATNVCAGDPSGMAATLRRTTHGTRHKHRLPRLRVTAVRDADSGWKRILNTLTMHYGERIAAATNHDHHALTQTI